MFNSLIQPLTDIAKHLIDIKASEKVKSADSMHQVVGKLMNDERISPIIYMFEHNPDWCHEFPIRDRGLERDVDYTLYYLSYVIYLHNQKFMDDDVFGCVEYLIVRAITNPSTARYLQFIRDFSESNKIRCPFELLMKFAETYQEKMK